MAPDSRIAVLEMVAVAPPPFAVRSYAAVADYWALTKPEINFLIGIATFAGNAQTHLRRVLAQPLLDHPIVRFR